MSTSINVQSSITQIESPKAAICLRGVSKKILSAQGRKIVIRNAEFSLASGKIGAVFGFSGSGKSNLLEIIGGLQKVDAGEVVVAGTDLTTLTRDEILSFRRNLISFVFESDNLIPDLQVQENLELPFILAKKEISRYDFESITQLFKLNHILTAYPEELSLFAARKVAIARAFLTGNPILLAFNPVAAISPQEQQQLLSFLQIAAREKQITVLFSTDLPSATAIADTAYLMQDSQLVGEIESPTTRTVLFALEALNS